MKGSIIIISATGMAAGGRVLHHLQLRLPDPKTTVLLAGYQAVGTRSRLQDGAKTVRIYGEDVPINAKVEILDGLSAYADQNEILKWLSGFEKRTKANLYLHGEPEGANALMEVIKKKNGIGMLRLLKTNKS